jgi:hypothetical protein
MEGPETRCFELTERLAEGTEGNDQIFCHDIQTQNLRHRKQNAGRSSVTTGRFVTYYLPEHVNKNKYPLTRNYFNFQNTLTF